MENAYRALCDIVKIDPAQRGLSENYEMKSDIEALEHAYCISVHKSQGSEFEAVVLPLVSGPPMLMNRNLLYTAVTRAKDIVVIVGSSRALSVMVCNNRIPVRHTALKHLFGVL